MHQKINYHSSFSLDTGDLCKGKCRKGNISFENPRKDYCLPEKVSQAEAHVCQFDHLMNGLKEGLIISWSNIKNLLMHEKWLSENLTMLWHINRPG